MELIIGNAIFRCFPFAIVFLFSCTQLAYGKWQGPDTIIKASFGSGESQIGMIQGDVDTFDEFPTLISFDENENIFIGDEINKKILIFNKYGSLEKILYPKIDLNQHSWPIDLFALGENKLLVVSGYDNQIYDYNGNLQKNINIGEKSVFWSGAYGNNFVISTVKRFIKFDINGNFVGETDKRIDECGDFYPNKYDKCTFSEKGDFFGIMNSYVEKFSRCKILLSKLEIPDDLEFQGEVDQSGEQYVFQHDRYGEPYVSPSGNVFTWLVTPNDYKIVKWTWVDDPSDPQPGPGAPANLKLTPSLDGLYLTWGASPQDPGCVDGYELERATSADGIYTTVTATDSGVLKFNDTGALTGTTYFYKVRAKGGGEYSPYTVEVSGKRQ